MSVEIDIRELEAFEKKLSELGRDAPDILDELVLGEGEFMASYAKKHAREKHIFNTGYYWENFHFGDKNANPNKDLVFDGSQAQRRGNLHIVDVYNNADYAIHIEYGFRSHWVPGYWAGDTFVYQPGAPGGMYVGPKGGYVPGRNVMRRAETATKATMNARLLRKLEKILENRINRSGGR